MVATTARMLDLPTDVIIVPVGSVAESSEIFRRQLEQAIHAVLPGAQIRTPMVPAVAGAAFLALQQIGITLPVDIFRQLQDVV